jgi:hypothetical protein
VRPYLKKRKKSMQKKAGSMAQMVEHLPSKKKADKILELSNEDFAFDVCFEVRACCDVPEFK